MYIDKIQIRNYRNYSEQSLTFSPNYNFIIGDNGHGKTNLIEAIYLLSIAKSFRLSVDSDLIKKGDSFFYIKGEYFNDDNDIRQTLEIGYDKNKKNLKHNGQVQKRVADWIGNLKAIVLLNQDIELILGSASTRRRFMDMVISLSDNTYLVDLQQYNKAIKSRNKLLKQKNSIFDVYDQQLIDYGSSIIEKRLAFFDDIKNYARDIFALINSDIQDFNLQYQPSLGRQVKSDGITRSDISVMYRDCLSKNRERDIITTSTSVGIHRDDFNIKNGKEMFKKFASQGQSRVGALTLKMIATKYIENASGEKVIMLLDDILLDLDVKKKNNFLELVRDHQCFFTSTDSHGIGSINPNSVDSRIFKIENGSVQK